MARKGRSDLMDVLMESVEGIHRAGLMDKVTYHHFKELCLEPVIQMTPRQIQKLRQEEKASQRTFANLLNTSLSTIQKWETGEKKPSGAALMLLHVVREKGLGAVIDARSGERPGA